MTSKKPKSASRKSPLTHTAAALESRAKKVSRRLKEAPGAAQKLGGRARGFVRANPAVAIGGALAVGFVLAKAARLA